MRVSFTFIPNVLSFFVPAAVFAFFLSLSPPMSLLRFQKSLAEVLLTVAHQGLKHGRDAAEEGPLRETIKLGSSGGQEQALR
jgi:hypothetical protein